MKMLNGEMVNELLKFPTFYNLLQIQLGLENMNEGTKNPRYYFGELAWTNAEYADLIRPFVASFYHEMET